MLPSVLWLRPTGMLILACALAACGGSDGGGGAATGTGVSGTAKPDTQAQTQPAAANDASDVRYAP